jgi:hypothetical protein
MSLKRMHCFDFVIILILIMDINYMLDPIQGVETERLVFYNKIHLEASFACGIQVEQKEQIL